MIALVFKDRMGYRVELFSAGIDAEERFYASMDDPYTGKGPDDEEYEYEDGYWISENGEEECWVKLNVDPPKGMNLVPRLSVIFGLIGFVCMILTGIITFVNSFF